MKNNRQAIVDRLLKGRKIGNHRLEGLVTEMATHLGQVRLLIFANPLESGNQIAEQLQAIIVILLDISRHAACRVLPTGPLRAARAKSLKHTEPHR